MLETGKYSVPKNKPSLIFPAAPDQKGHREVWLRIINSPWLWIGGDDTVSSTNDFSLRKEHGIVGPIKLAPADEMWGFCTKSSTVEWMVANHYVETS